MTPTLTDKVLVEVELERARQDNLWGEQNHSLLVWNVILGEEVGEVQQALYGWRFGLGDRANLRSVREELIQVAAVAVAFVESIDRNDGGERP